MTKVIYFDRIESPIGELLLTSDGTSLTGTHMELSSGKETTPPDTDWIRDSKKLAIATKQLREYFAGKRTRFDLRMNLEGTPFQKKVWNELCKIPYGTTISYGELANRIGNAKASRAVGMANGRNPIGIIVPCHRVIGANGKLTGYGGGMWRKEWLLNLEARQS